MSKVRFPRGSHGIHPPKDAVLLASFVSSSGPRFVSAGGSRDPSSSTSRSNESSAMSPSSLFIASASTSATRSRARAASSARRSHSSSLRLPSSGGIAATWSISGDGADVSASAVVAAEPLGLSTPASVLSIAWTSPTSAVIGSPSSGSSADASVLSRAVCLLLWFEHSCVADLADPILRCRFEKPAHNRR